MGSSGGAGWSRPFDASRYRNHDEKQIYNAFVPERGHFLILIAADQSNRFIHLRVPMSGHSRRQTPWLALAMASAALPMPEQPAQPVPLTARERKFAARTLYFSPDDDVLIVLDLNPVFKVSLWPVGSACFLGVPSALLSRQANPALGQKQTCAAHQLMSALPPIATIKADMVMDALARRSKASASF